MNDGMMDSGLAYCRLHHGVIEIDEGDGPCDNAAEDLHNGHTGDDGEPRPCDPTPLLYVGRPRSEG